MDSIPDMAPANELTRCSDALALSVAALLPRDHDDRLIAAFRAALSDLLAATLGGATTMAAGAVVALDSKVEKLANKRAAQLQYIQIDLDRVAERVHALEDEFLPKGSIGRLENAIAAIALEVEVLKSRVVGDGSS